MKAETYIIGSGKAPEWCRRFLQPYQKPDGSTGYEFHGKRRDADLCAGDKLIRKDKRIKIIRREGKR